MTAAWSIVGGFAVIVELIKMAIGLDLADSDGSDIVGGLSILAFVLLITFFVCALSMNAGVTATITVAIIGGLAIVGSFMNGYFAVIMSSKAKIAKGGFFFACIGVLLVIATYVLALCHVHG